MLFRSVSLDGIAQRFEYLRWPASWNQVTENLLELRESVPSNVMFLIEETVSIFNLFYLGELDQWVVKNFATNREGDPVIHTKHLAHGIYRLDNCSARYRDAMKNSKYCLLLPDELNVNVSEIKTMLSTIDKFDQFRNQCFGDTFPEVKEFYSTYL